MIYVNSSDSNISFPIESSANPGIMRLAGKSVIIAGDVSVVVPVDFSFADISRFVVKRRAVTPRENKFRIVEVPSSKPNKPGYRVKIFPNGNKICECPAFQFRKTCKHLEKAK